MTSRQDALTPSERETIAAHVTVRRSKELRSHLRSVIKDLVSQGRLSFDATHEEMRRAVEAEVLRRQAAASREERMRGRRVGLSESVLALDETELRQMLGLVDEIDEAARYVLFSDSLRAEVSDGRPVPEADEEEEVSRILTEHKSAGSGDHESEVDRLLAERKG